MSDVQVSAFKCDVCGFVWLPKQDEKERPKICASRSCRSAKWDVYERPAKHSGDCLRCGLPLVKWGPAQLRCVKCQRNYNLAGVD